MSDAPDNLDAFDRETNYIGGGVFISRVHEPKQLEEMNLHRVSALLIKNISPIVTRHQLESMCRAAHGGFLRLHVGDPNPHDRYMREAIVSFWFNANLKKIGWKLRGTHLAGEPLIIADYVDNERRIAIVDGLAADRAVVLRDIHICKNMIEFLDKKERIWEVCFHSL